MGSGARLYPAQGVTGLSGAGAKVILTTKDMPLGTIAPEAEYNLLLPQAIKTVGSGESLSDDQIEQLDRARRSLWGRFVKRKAQGMRAFAGFAADRYGFERDDTGKLQYAWKRDHHKRVGWESDFYGCDLAQKKLVPQPIDHRKRRVIVFATGRAFAERNERLAHLTPQEAMVNARHVMSAQVYLVGSRMVGGYPDDDDVEVVAVAYDMVTSEEETPALRIQSILDPQFIHPVCAMAAERIFAGMIADAELNPNGTIVRRHGRLAARPLRDDLIIRNLSGLALVGASVGCIVAHQVVRCLEALLGDLGVGDHTRDAARQSCFIMNLGPTTTLPFDGSVNMISIINRNDEFVFAGNDVAPIIEASDASRRCIVPDHHPDGGTSDHRFNVVLDVPGTITRNENAWVFDPLPEAPTRKAMPSARSVTPPPTPRA